MRLLPRRSYSTNSDAAELIELISSSLGIFTSSPSAEAPLSTSS